jgi:tungstate transport system substrate-binding protein
MNRISTSLKLAATALLLSLGLHAQAQTPSIVVASTTSTEQSGLFAHILPIFKQASGIDVKVVALGTGQAIDMARRGDADVLFVHDTAKENVFVADGFADKRYNVMYNDFVVVGPKSDPAGARGNDIGNGFQRIAAEGAAFISRGDKSGTHAAELRYWKLLGDAASKGAGYKECGCGMGPALNMASASNAYALTDRATWLNFKNRDDLRVLLEGDKRLFNQYGIMLVSAAKHPHVKTALGQQFVNWVLSPAGQTAIGSYTIGDVQLFFPNAQ